MAMDANEYPTQMFLQWFVKEQVEEEANATAILEMLRIGGDKGNALLMIDRHLAARKED
jgi:ferritin